MSRSSGRTEPRAGTLISMPSAPSASTSAASASSTSRRSTIASSDAIPRNTLKGTRTVLFESGTTTGFCTTSPGVSVGAGQHAAEHHGVAAERQRLHERAVALDAAVGNQRHAPVGRRAALRERLHLRDAEVRVQPRRAAAARSDADLDAVDALLEQEAHALGGRDVAGDELDVAEPLPERLDRARHDGRMAVRDVDDDDVDLARAGAPRRVRGSRPSRRSPRRRAAGRAHRASRTEAAAATMRSLAVISPRSVPSAFSSGSFLIFCFRIVSSACAVSGSPVCATSRSRGVMRDATVPPLIHEPQVARRQQPLHPPLVVDDDERADARVAHPGGRFGEAGVRPDRVGIADDAVLLALDDLDFADLRLDLAAAEAAVDDAEPAFFRDGDRHLGARDGVHVGGDDRPLELRRREKRDVRSMVAGSRRSTTLYCGVKRKSSKVQPRTRARAGRSWRRGHRLPH